jgi:hypothetical protein
MKEEEKSALLEAQAEAEFNLAFEAAQEAFYGKHEPPVPLGKSDSGGIVFAAPAI